MKSSFVLLLAAIIVVMLSGLALAQYPGNHDNYFQDYMAFNTMGGGARAAGMGGAFLGLSEGEYSFSMESGRDDLRRKTRDRITAKFRSR